MSQDTQYMQRCLDLAANGLGHTRSNPMVGCVVVRGGKIIAEGYHKEYGGPHAEVEALKYMDDLENCTVYVSLEPCSHHGKTPPCADLLISKGVKKLVVASQDPNPLVSGKGVQKLRAAGIDVTVGIMDEENRELNRRFFTFHEKKRPYIVLKWAQSQDGFIAPLKHQGQFKLTGNTADVLVHQWRAEEMGILVGRKTIEQDDPQLNVRHAEGINPVRIVIDPGNKITGNKKVFNETGSAIFYTKHHSKVNRNILHVAIEHENFLEGIMKDLHQRNVLSVLVEGGAFTLNEFIKKDLWDEARVFTCNVLLANGIPAPLIAGNQIYRDHIGNDELTITRAV